MLVPEMVFVHPPQAVLHERPSEAVRGAAIEWGWNKRASRRAVPMCVADGREGT